MTTRTNRARQPAEWQEHEACWLAWPSHPDEWLGDLTLPRQNVAELCAAIADVDPGTGEARGERVDLLVLDDEGVDSARALLGATPVCFHRIPFGDIWLRDTGPVFVHGPEGLTAACFHFNGWGEKYLFEHDPEVGSRIAASVSVPFVRHHFVFEGGAIEVDGEGTGLTTRQCLFEARRNPALDADDIERRLHDALGIDKLIWLERGLQNDHTDGHIDTLVRFVRPGVVVCMRAHDDRDVNREVLTEIARDLGRFRDAGGRRLEVVEIPSPGLLLGPDGMPVPASYANFYIGNRTVVVPTYGSPYDAEAVREIGALFPDRRTVGVDASGVIRGGGAFHCITQQQPLGLEEERT